MNAGPIASPNASHLPRRILHTMLRVADLERSLAFYVGVLRMTLHRKQDYSDGRFTLAFVGYGDGANGSTIELTHNWGGTQYELGTAYGHMALEVEDVEETCRTLSSQGVAITRPAGPMASSSPQPDAVEVIAFIADPDGYAIELIEARNDPRARAV